MQIFINALIAGSFAALMAGGLSLVYGVLNVFNMALGQFALSGGYVAWWLVSVDVPLPLAIIGGLLAGGMVTALSYEIAVAPFYKRHRFLPLVTTIALSILLQGLILMIFKDDPKTIIPDSLHPITIGGAILSSAQAWLIVATLLFLALSTWLLAATSLGRRIRATVSHPAAAQSLGVNVELLHRAVFIFSGILAASAGIFQAIDLNITPVMGFPITIKAYAALIAGGKDSLKGTIFCAYLIALLEQLAVGIPWFGGYIPAGYQGTVALIVILAILLFKPEGLFGSTSRRA